MHLCYAGKLCYELEKKHNTGSRIFFMLYHDSVLSKKKQKKQCKINHDGVLPPFMIRRILRYLWVFGDELILCEYSLFLIKISAVLGSYLI